MADTTSPNNPVFGSGENVNCDVEAGLNVLLENVELGGSVMVLLSDVVLCECGCLYPLLAKLILNPIGPSLSSALPLVAEETRGESRPTGDVGEIPPGVCEVDTVGDSVSNRSRLVLSGIAVSEALRISLPGAMPCFCLNFSIQDAVIVFSGMSDPVQNTLAFSSISWSFTTTPFFCWPLTQFARARSMSGDDLPLVFFTGEALRSSWFKYWSFLRKTLDTVLWTWLIRLFLVMSIV